MLVDTQPATLQHVSASPEVREEWVGSQLIGVLMDNAMPLLLSGVLSLPVTAFFMAGEVNTTALVVWTCLMCGLFLDRYRVIGIYRLRYDSVGGAMRMAFVKRYTWTWAFGGISWGFLMSLAFMQASLLTQFVCCTVLLAQAVASLLAFSAYLPVFRRYISYMAGTVALGILVPALWDSFTLKRLELILPLVLLVLIFWCILLSAGKRLHQVHRSSFELQFSNQELIDSLTLQTLASQRAVTAKNRFLASAAHDLRQPVHALSLYADWLATEPEMAREISPRILQSTRAINELFDSLFDLTRIDAGNYKVRLQHVDVMQLFADLMLQFEPVASGKSLKLKTYAKPTHVWADPVVLRRILGNLLSNALRHTSSGGVLLGLRRREGFLVFEVWDTGVGIAREHQQAIFQEFFRVSQHQGTEDSLGLGLTIVSKLATLMGYQLALSSQTHRGSVFRLMLPHFTQKPLMPDVLT